MSDFKEFLINEAKNEESKDVQTAIRQIPKAHQKLVKHYHIKFISAPTLKDGKSIGSNNMSNQMVIASPWRYGREFAFLHEIGHLVWREYIEPDKKLKSSWEVLVKKIKHTGENKEALNQNPEEIFCMVYAASYATHKILTYYKPEWVRFVKRIASA